MRRPKRSWLLQVIEVEKQEMLPLNFMMSYRVVPVYALLSFLLIAGFGVLLAADEAKYFVPAMALMGAVAAMSIALLASLPFVRKRAIRVELARYCFDENGAEVELPYRLTADEQELSFDRAGLELDGVRVDYSDLSCRIATNNYCRRIHVSLWICPPEDEDGVMIPLTGQMPALLKVLPIPLENPELLDYIRTHREAAFRQIYDKGFVTLPK